jgi:hypothetical protein
VRPAARHPLTNETETTVKYLTNDDFAGQNWLITPTARATDQSHHQGNQAQGWLVVLTGVVSADIAGNSTNQWLHETVSFTPDLDAPLNFALESHGIPRPDPSVDYLLRFSLQQWAPFASLSSIYDSDTADNFGAAVDVWRPAPFASGTNALTDQPVGNLFDGINVDLAVRDTDAWLYRLGYSITLIGNIVFIDNSLV